MAVQTGEMLLRIGDATGALEVFLQALDSGLDRCQVDKARLPENQNQLSLVSRPVAEKVTSQALNGINRCFAALRPQEAMCAVELERVTSAWLHSLTATYQADGRAASAFESLSADASQTAWWRQLCLWKASRAYFREGCFRDSLMLLERMAASDVPMPLLEHLHFLHGYALLGLGDAVQAASWLERASKATCKVLASVSLLHLAEALECQQEFKVAMETWDRLLSSSVIWHRREAEYAKKRLGWMKEKVRGNCNDKSIAVLPDDRSTHGDWPLAYGKDFHLLAAHNFRGDYIGGRIARPKYRFRTSSDHERGRLWVSKKDSLDCAALWNPRRHRHMSANRDDFGEQHYLGNGPDLIMDINLPPGTHILSLYFVNDPHFYELNRAYTITISEKEGKVLAIGQVRHFGAGIYKRYAIDGPKTIECRIWRNVSINVLLCGVFLDKPILSIPEKQLFDDINNAALCQRYAELSREVEKSTAEKLPQLANQCASLSQEFLLGDPTISRLWLASRLMNLLGLTGRGRDLVHKLSSKIIRKEDVYTFIMRNFPLASIEDQINLGWHRPGTHALDILWNRYFALSEKESLDISFMFSLSQSSDWRVTSKAMRQAGILVSREHMKLPESVSLATDFCHVTKMIQERNYYEALPLLEQLEVRAETIKDKVILMRVREHLLNLSSSVSFSPQRLMLLYDHFMRDGGEVEKCSITAIRVVNALERQQRFREARDWLDGVPPAILPEVRRRAVVRRLDEAIGIIEKAGGKP